jgi:chromosome segregation ATPase
LLQKLKTFQAKREKREQELTQVESLTSGPDEEQERKQERMDQLIEEANEAADTKRTLEGELKRAQAPVKVKQRELNQIEKEQGHAARSLQKAKRHLQEERERILAASGQSDEAKRAATLKKAEQELDQIREELQQVKQSATANQRKYDELGPSVEQTKSQGDSIKNQLGGIQTKIKQLESSDTDSLAMFGRTCTKVDRLVKQAHREKRWTGPVAGPIGAHVKIASGKEQFASIAEQALGNSTLGRFVVTNDNDRKLLQRIREQTGCPSNECSIFQVAESPRYRVPPPPAADVETVASCLNIEDDLVFNALVDHARIDQRALCASKDISERSLLDKDGQGRLTIRGGTIKEVFFLPHGDKWSIMNNNLAMVSNERQLKKTLGVDKSAAVIDLKAEADQLLGELKEIRDQQTHLEREQKDYQKKWNADRSNMRKSQQRAEQLSDIIDQAKAEAEEAANVTVDTTELEDDVSKAEQVVEAIEQQKSKKQREIDELLPGVQDMTNRLAEVSARNEKVLADMNAAEQDLATYLQTLSQRQAQLDKKKAKVEQMQEIITKQDNHVQKLVADRDSALHKARLLHYRREFARTRKEELEENGEMSPSATGESAVEPSEDELLSIEPVQPQKKAAFYRSKIDRAKARIEKEKQRRRLTESDPEVAFQKYIRAEKDLDANMQQIAAIDGKVELLSQDLKDRKRRWKQFRSHIATMSNVTFNEILNMKGSSGTIEFDHDNKTLDLVVQNDSSQASQTKDVKALSGGERSFTTLALLLALGEQLETPFRVMDEFDVFLDPVARKIALDTLVSFIGEHRYCDGLTPRLTCSNFVSLFSGVYGQVDGASSIHLYHAARSFCFED